MGTTATGSITLALVVGLTWPAAAVPVTYSVTGTLADAGSFSGSWTYEDSAPIATNIRNLSPNYQWQVLSSSFTFSSLLAPAETGSVTELCTGKCVFASADVSYVMVTSATQSLRLSFQPNWGALNSNGSWLTTPQYIIMARTATLEGSQTLLASVPEPSTIWLMWLSLAQISMAGYLANKFRIPKPIENEWLPCE